MSTTYDDPDENSGVFVVNLGVRQVDPQELIDHFNGSSGPELGYSPEEISYSLAGIAQQGDSELFGKMVDSYLGFVERCTEKFGGDSDNGPLNMGIGAARVDTELLFRKTLEHETSYPEMYQDSSTYGPTMRALADHFGVEGPDLMTILFGE